MTMLRVELNKFMLVDQLTGPIEQFFPNLFKLFNLKRSLPVGSAEAERSFSVMKRVKSRLRNNLKDEKMSDLCLIAIEKDLGTDVNSIIDVYNCRNRRLPL